MNHRLFKFLSRQSIFICIGNQKFQKREKYLYQMWFWRKVPRSSKTCNHRKMKKNIIEAQQLSIWDIWQKMLLESGDLLSKYQIITILLPPQVHPMHRHLDETQFDSVIALTQAGGRPGTVLSSLLQQDPNTAASSKLFPMLKQWEELNICGALLQSLQESDWKYSNEIDTKGTSNADHVSFCGGNHYRKTPCWNRNS